MKLWRSTVNQKWSNVSDSREPEVVRLLIHSTTDVPSGRMYQTSVRLLIHSTTDVPSGRMYQIWWKSMKIYEIWYIRPLTFQVVECIRSDGIGLPSDFWYIPPLTFKLSNVSDLVKISKTLWKSIEIIGNLMKLVWTSMKINEYLSKSHEYLWKSYENL